MRTLDILSQKIKINIDGIKDSTNRSRSVLIFSNLAALMIFITLYNQEFSWQEHININERPYTKYESYVGIDSGPLSENELRKHYADMYFDKQFFTVPLLGLKCSGSDLTVYAPIAMLIFSTWLFFSIRRENHIIRDILQDFKQIQAKLNTLDPKSIEEISNWKILFNTLYSGCIQNFVLLTATNNDFIKRSESFGKNMIARPIKILFEWMPIFILLFVLYTDLENYFDKEIMKQHKYELIGLDSFLIIIGGFIVYQIVITRNIEKETASMLSSMTDAIKNYDYSL